jgi:hypothetical protein
LNPSSGTVSATPAETALQTNAVAQFADYTSRYLPVQAHLSSVVDAMASPNSWENQEAEGKGNADVAEQFARTDQQRTAAQQSKGINVGSGSFKFGVTGAASAEAETKGAAINQAHETIQNAYLSGLQSIGATGQGIAGAATGNLAVGGEVGSREAISGAQVSNAQGAATMSTIGMGLGTVAGILGKPGGDDDPASFNPAGYGATGSGMSPWSGEQLETGSGPTQIPSGGIGGVQ